MTTSHLPWLVFGMRTYIEMPNLELKISKLFNLKNYNKCLVVCLELFHKLWACIFLYRLKPVVIASGILNGQVAKTKAEDVESSFMWE